MYSFIRAYSRSSLYSVWKSHYKPFSTTTSNSSTKSNSNSSSSPSSSSSSRSARSILSGVFAPIPTPFSRDNVNQLKLSELEINLLQWLSPENSSQRMMDGVCVLGSNGEFPLLREAEKRTIIEHVAKTVRNIHGASEIRLIAGTGCVSTMETIELTRFAEQLGYDAAMVVTPYYYTSRMNQQRLAQHFIAVANAVNIPIVLYSMPSFAGGIAIEKELVSQLARHPNIIGMKDSSGDVENLRQLVNATVDEDFAMLAGTGSVLYQCLMHGATGGIMAQANVMGDKLRYLHRLFIEQSQLLTADHERGLALNRILAPLNSLLTAKYSIPALKYALDSRGYYGGPVRLPFLPLKESEAREVDSAFAEADQQWNDAVAKLAR